MEIKTGILAMSDKMQQVSWGHNMEVLRIFNTYLRAEISHI